MLASLLACVVTARVSAASADAPGQAVKSERTQVASADTQAGMRDAFAFAKSKNPTAADARLATLSRAKPNTWSWHINVAQRLIQVATHLSREGDGPSAKPLAEKALSHANAAEKIATSASDQGTAKMIAAFVQERFLGDVDGARANYEAVAKMSLKATAASESAERLKRADEASRARGSDTTK